LTPSLEKNQGELQRNPLVEIIGRIYADKRSGELQVKVKKAEYKIFFLNGVPVNAQSSLKSDHLFEFMVHLGLVEREDVPRLHNLVKEGLDPDKAILQMGLSDTTKIYYLQQLLAREIIIRACSHTEGKYQFKEREDFLETMPLYDLSPMDIIYDGLNRHHLISLPEKIQKMANARIRLNPELPELQGLPEIFYERSYLLDDFKDEMPVERAINFLFNEFRDINQALIFLYVMLITGVLIMREEKQESVKKPIQVQNKLYIPKSRTAEKSGEQSAEKGKKIIASDYIFVSEKRKKSIQGKPDTEEPKELAQPEDLNKTKPEPVAKKESAGSGHSLDQERKLELLETKIRSSNDYFQILGIKPDATIGELEQVYNQILEQFEIEEIIKAQDTELAPRANALKETIKKIINTLTDPQDRNQYEKSIYKEELKRAWNLELRKALARKQFERGKWYLEHNKPDFALERFEQAIELDPEVPDYYIYNGWALYRAGKGTVAEAEGYLKHGLKQNPRADRAYYFLAMIAKRDRADALAEEYLQKALSINPNNAQARREMESLERHKKESLFQKLFPKK